MAAAVVSDTAGSAVALPSEEELEALLSAEDRDDDDRLIRIAPAHRDDLNGFSILARVPLEVKRTLVERSRSDVLLDRCMGSMCGMAVGDSLGHVFEFLPAVDVPGPDRFDLQTLRFHGGSNAFRLERGQWTDDASMGLCMADSLIMRRCFDGSDMRVRFWCWWNRGYNNAFRKDPTRGSSVGLGGNIAKSLVALTNTAARGEAIPPTYDARTEDAGNGSLMRFTPVAIFFQGAATEELYDAARLSSYTTHPGIIAAEACSLLAHLIVAALRRPAGEPVDAKRFLEAETAAYRERSGLVSKSGWGYDQMNWLVTGQPPHATERCWRWREECLDIQGTLRARGNSYNGYPVSAGYFGSYALDGLAMALWAVYHTRSFDEAVTKSINLLGDADSHGSIAGQLAGALYGYSSIHPQFLAWLNRWDDHEFAVRAVMLQHLGRGPGGTSATASPPPQPQPALGRVTTATVAPAPPVLSRLMTLP
eukprot:TRINITY_DN4580_c0_g1_i1.p1 TRINITY_DN4580_c0_g1~~TRINITY_DN4580_c0_g1_i1.p1  ORF type:complete len:479 (-),score=80.26 TRINITY_DN4580_c0_g1_i1:150-1586(-)